MTLELPHINVLSKVDILKRLDKQLHMELAACMVMCSSAYPLRLAVLAFG
jgi:hypothetical protein